MKCPHCGHEMPEEYLICDQCGEEIQIVPDFEPEIENSISETLSTLVSLQEEGSGAELLDEMEAEPEREPEVSSSRSDKRGRGVQIVLALAILFVVGLISYALYAYHVQTVEYQISRAETYAQKGNYEQAIACLETAYAAYPEEARILFLEADYYYLQKQDTAALSALMRIIDKENASRYSEVDVEEA